MCAKIVCLFDRAARLDDLGVVVVVGNAQTPAAVVVRDAQTTAAVVKASTTHSRLGVHINFLETT